MLYPFCEIFKRYSYLYRVVFSYTSSVVAFTFILILDNNCGNKDGDLWMILQDLFLPS